ncbi:MAG TPA: carbohydrate ABC transporter permease [Mesotoga infera]|jgi:trehalose/maltose transport system permease protein|uniref:Trehalose transport system permease protein SugB n=1 Tax=Mesotoga infera TaxID=1236046 RepID=A0A7Z7LHN4_9BACT|nr:carbohydrate ABC transporter permease [Mesotoga infera]MBP8661122.1 carbohydrate ABC transporter permease [Mesotoga sp.]NLI06418.1 carbohydrate ABC transporter permease [Thermotogaceae bacterium]SSC13638.1 Trehalose transport system permease protein SugB [Mesotoga infera]HNS66139.1 carbohydrate ABC transporter permease [Mesotoga infera]HON27184.1 carbohydrate ABC transporter permease [Mesotoga infera]
MTGNKRTLWLLGKIGFWILVIFIFFYMLFPFYWAVNSSLKSEAQLQMTPATFLPVDSQGRFSPTLQNYVAIFKDGTFVRALWNSTIVAGLTTILALCVGSFAAYAMGKLRFKGKKATLYLILSLTMFPQITVLSGLYAVITTLNLSTRLSLILSYMIFTLPFTTWVLTAFFKELPSEIMQSARVDGATPFQTFRMILLPLTAPAMVTSGLLAFIAAWNEYIFALTFTTIAPGARTIPVAISLFTGSVSRQVPFGEIMAGAVVVTVPIVVLVFIFQRRIVQGLTAGAVKG